MNRPYILYIYIYTYIYMDTIYIYFTYIYIIFKYIHIYPCIYTLMGCCRSQVSGKTKARAQCWFWMELKFSVVGTVGWKKNAWQLVGNWSKSSGSGEDEIWNVSVQSVFVLRVVSPHVLFWCVNLKHYRKLKSKYKNKIIILKATAGPKSLLFKLHPRNLTWNLKRSP